MYNVHVTITAIFKYNHYERDKQGVTRVFPGVSHYINMYILTVYYIHMYYMHVQVYMHVQCISMHMTVYSIHIIYKSETYR